MQACNVAINYNTINILIAYSIHVAGFRMGRIILYKTVNISLVNEHLGFWIANAFSSRSFPAKSKICIDCNSKQRAIILYVCKEV